MAIGMGEERQKAEQKVVLSVGEWHYADWLYADLPENIQFELLMEVVRLDAASVPQV